MPDDPDPKINFIKKSLPIVGSVFPDMPVTFIWQYIAKRIKKSSIGSIIALRLTKDDYDTYAGQASPWIEIYKTFHGLPFLIFTASVEIIKKQHLVLFDYSKQSLFNMRKGIIKLFSA
jgi:hypothetical protein